MLMRINLKSFLVCRVLTPARLTQVLDRRPHGLLRAFRPCHNDDLVKLLTSPLSDGDDDADDVDDLLNHLKHLGYRNFQENFYD